MSDEKTTLNEYLFLGILGFVFTGGAIVPLATGITIISLLLLDSLLLTSGMY